MSTSSADSDDLLVARVRGGEVDLYDLLFERHIGRARRVARSVLDHAADVDDVVSESFASVLGALQRNKGPTQGFVGYLVSTVRHEAYRANRRRSHRRRIGDDAGEQAVDPFAGREDAAIVRAAFGSLPSVSREVLWHTEVEGRSHADIARSVGSTSQAIGARASRARVALGGAYLARHLDLAFDEPPSSGQCSEVRAQLVDLVRGRSSPTQRRVLEGHLAACQECREGRDRLERLNERLRTGPLLPVATGLSTITTPVSLLSRLAPFLAGAAAVTTLATAALVAPSLGDADSPHAISPPASTASIASSQPDRVEGAASPARREPDAPAVAGDVPEPAATAPSAAAGPVVVATPADPSLGGPLAAPAVTAPATPTPTPPVTQPSTETTTPPIVVVPALTVPPVTVPALTVPSLAVPALTVPSLTVPSISTPLLTTPVVTTPVITTPAITTPAITTPVITTPVITTPAITVPPLLGP